MAERSGLSVSAATSIGGSTRLKISGTLDSSTYHQARNSVISAAIEEPEAVVVDVSELHAPAESAWAAFTSARWHVSRWPDIPVVLVCDHEAGRAAIERSGAARHVPVHGDERAAAQAVRNPRGSRRRATAGLDADRGCLRSARALMAKWLTQWAHADMVIAASTVATVFLENVLEHTTSRPVLLVEAIDDRVMVVVCDESRELAARQELSCTRTVSGLAIVAALSRSWGCNPTAEGKTVWAVLGPENRL